MIWFSMMNNSERHREHSYEIQHFRYSVIVTLMKNRIYMEICTNMDTHLISTPTPSSTRCGLLYNSSSSLPLSVLLCSYMEYLAIHYADTTITTGYIITKYLALVLLVRPYVLHIQYHHPSPTMKKLNCPSYHPLHDISKLLVNSHTPTRHPLLTWK